MPRCRDAAARRRLDLGQLDRRRRRALPPVLPQGAARARGRRRSGTRRRRSATRARSTSSTGRCTRTRCCPTPSAGTTSRCGPARSVRGDDGVWRMYYTALSTRPGPRRQGPADRPRGVRRPDHLAARRRPAAGRARPALVPHDRRHRHSETWRDPFVFADPGRRRLAHADHRPRTRTRRASATACSPTPAAPTCATWELQPPLTEPAGFGQIEVPQIRVVDGRHAARRSPATRRSRAPSRSSASARTAPGPCSATHRSARGTSTPRGRSRPTPKLFAAPLVQQRDGTWAFVGFRNQEPEGIFVVRDRRPDPGRAPRRRASGLVAGAARGTPAGRRSPTRFFLVFVRRSGNGSTPARRTRCP